MQPSEIITDGGIRRGKNREQTLKYVAVEFRKVPLTATTRLVETGTGVERRVRVDFDDSILAGGRVVDQRPVMYVNWWPDDGERPPAFVFHYVDSSGIDCGWHRHENDHVDGRSHVQWRTSSDGAYTYESVDFEHDHPIGLVWEIAADRLETRLLEIVD